KNKLECIVVEIFCELQSYKAGPTRHCHYVHLQVFHFSPSGSSRLRAFYLNTKVQDQKPRSSTGQGLGKISKFLENDKFPRSNPIRSICHLVISSPERDGGLGDQRSRNFTNQSGIR